MDELSNSTTTRSQCPACKASVTLVTIPDGTPIAAWRRPLGGRRAGPTDRDPVTEVCPVCRERVDWSLCGVLVDLWKGHGADPDEDEQIDLGDLT